MSAPLSHVALIIATIVVNGLWEGPLIAGLVWLAVRFAPHLGAATRYAVWFGTLIAIVVAPMVTAGPRDSRNATDSRPIANGISAPGHAVALAPARAIATASRNAVASIDTARIAMPLPLSFFNEAATTASARRPIEISQTVALGVTMLWLLFALVRVLRLVRDGRRLATIRREARLWSTAHGVPILVSDHVDVPIATGFRHRAIVLPAKVVANFENVELDAIVIHEVAHLRRNDVWTNLLARVLEAIGATDPATWFVMRALSIEREFACDDWVVARTGSGAPFARTLAALANVARVRMPIAAPSALGSRHAIVERIERLLDARPRRLSYSRSILGGTLMLLALIAIVLQNIAPALAYEAQTPDLARFAAPPAPANVHAGTCSIPNRGIRIMYLPGMNRFDRRIRPMNFELPDSSAIRSDPDRPLATFEVTVDATGKLVRGRVISPTNAPEKARLTRFLAGSVYEPALHNCVPSTATIRSAIHLQPPEANSVTVVTPIYPAGWSEQYGSSCKVPTVTHGRFRLGFSGRTPYREMLPAFPDSEKSAGVDTSYTTTIRVAVNGSTATRAVVIAPSGRQAFDESALLAARNATYPLISTACNPLPTAYLWKTTFAYQVFP